VVAPDRPAQREHAQHDDREHEEGEDHDEHVVTLERVTAERNSRCMTICTHAPTVAETLRGDPLERPMVDRTRAGGLRALLEDGIYDVVGANNPDVPIVIRSSTLRRDPPVIDSMASQLGRLRGVLVHQVLRLASVGVTPEFPFADALAAWRLDARGALVTCFDQLSSDDRARLEADVSAHAVTLRRALGDIPASWMPRSALRVSQRLAGGRVLLHDLVDLMVGTTSGVASVALLDLSTSPLGQDAERTLRYHALVQTLRTSIPPLRVSSFSSATGELWTSDVDDDLLNRAAHDVLEAVGAQWGRA